MKSAQETMDVLQVASNVYHLLMENDRVRMLKVTFNPGDKATMHHHPDHAVYVVKGGKLAFTYPSGNPESMEVESGSAFFLDTQTHEATNVGDTFIELIVVELK
jgi:beta-alanine degradation protein BauB